MGSTRDDDEADVEELVSVGCVGAHEARLFVRSPTAGAWRVRASEGPPLERRAPWAPTATSDHTGTITLDRLRPDARYALEVVSPAGRRSRVRFRTPPRPGARRDRVAIAVGSCHQPFEPDGSVNAFAASMLEETDALLGALDVDSLLLVGDQVYADAPPGLSLFDRAHFAGVAPPGRDSILDCTRAEVRALYQARSRRWLGLPAFQRLSRGRPTYLMLDDHEVVDNFGTHPAHQEPAWAALRDGALDAYHDYQGRRTAASAPRPPWFDFTLRIGPLALYALDLRSRRRVVDGQVWPYALDQLEALRDWLRGNEDAEVACVVLSVPLVHVPSWMANVGAAVEGEGGNAADRWSHEGHERARTLLVRALREAQRRRPQRRLVLLGGDVHVGAVHRIDWVDGGLPPIWQLTSSAITHREHRVFQWIAEVGAALPETLRTTGDMPSAHVHLARGVDGADENPFGGLNVGVLEVERRADGPSLRLSLHGRTSGEALRCVFDGGWC